MNSRGNILANTDWITILLYLLLIAFGWMNIYSVNHVEAVGFDFSLRNKYSMQLIWIGVSLSLAVLIFLIDSRFFNFIAFPGYIFALFLLLVVVVVGEEVNGAKSWISMGPIKIQPSEFAKLATILVLARFLSGFNIKSNSVKNILISLGLIAAPPVLIMLQPDLGSTLVYGAMLIVLYREGLPGWILLLIALVVGVFLGFLLMSLLSVIVLVTMGAFVGFFIVNKNFKNFYVAVLILAGVVGIAFGLKYLGVINYNDYLVYIVALAISMLILLIVALKKKIKGAFIVALFFAGFIGIIYSFNFVFTNVMKPHQQVRVKVMLGQESDPWGYEYNVNQSKIAIGSGGFAGRGFLQGPQTKLKYVPEQSTDFIFCTVGEEWGFLGSLGLVAAFVGLLIRLIYIAERQRSKFSRIYGYGVISILFFHFAVNIAMVIAIFPVIGIPLPFFSYGGSSLMAFTMMIFILLRLDSTRKSYLI